MITEARKRWLAIRRTMRGLWKHRILRWVVQVPAGGNSKDPGQFDRHRRLRGPLKRATGPGSYDAWKIAQWRERQAKRQARGAT